MTRSIYCFGDCRIDPAARELWRAGSLVALPPHVFDCLAYLVERHDRAVGRDELVSAVWGKTEISDTLLGQTVLRMRRELGDDGKEQRIVRTIPRFGYRWVAPLAPAPPGIEDDATVAATAEAALAPQTQPLPQLPQAPTLDTPLAPAGSTSEARRKHPFPVVVAIALSSLLVVAIVWTAMYVRNKAWPTHPTTSVTADAAISAAVIPAEVDLGAEWSWLRFSVMDVVATQLRTSGLPTVPSENMIALLQIPASRRIGSLRDAAGFQLLVTPRVSRDQGGWRVQLKADDGAGQQHIAEGSARDATEAARLAADNLLVALGRDVPAATADADPYAEQIKRVDAAILADDPATARALIERMPAAEQHVPELRLRLAKLDFRSGHVDAARKRLLVLLDEAPAQTAAVLRASILNGLGAVEIRSDRPQQAERYFAEAIDLLATRAEPEQLGQAYLGRAGAAQALRHFEDAAADYSRARLAFKQANDRLALVRVAANEGLLDLDQERPAQALPQLVAASTGFERWGALNEAIFTDIGQINAQLALLEPVKALDVAEAAALLAARIDNQDTHDSLSIAHANALAAVGRLREAYAMLESVREAHPTSGDATAAVAAIGLARIELGEGNYANAAQLAAAAVDALGLPAYVDLRARGWLVEAKARLHMPDTAQAAARLNAFETWADQVGEPRAKLFAQLARAMYASRVGDGKAWRVEFDRTLALAEQHAVPAQVVAVASAYAHALIGKGDLDAASVEVGRLSRWSDRDFDCAVSEARLYAALGRSEAHSTALARARALAGERTIPIDARAIAISTHQASGV